MPSIPSEFRDSNYQPIPYDGSPVQWRVSVYGICIIDNQLLLVNHTNERFHDAPGGGVDLDETLEQALEREGKEEAGWQLKMDKYIYVKSDWFYHTEENKFYKTLQHYYTVTGQKLLEKPTDPRIIFADLVPLANLEKYNVYPNVMLALQHLKVV